MSSKRDDDAMYGVLAPWIFIFGSCGILLILVILDAIFNLGLT